MSSQYLADSSLSEDVSQYDFSTPIQVNYYMSRIIFFPYMYLASVLFVMVFLVYKTVNDRVCSSPAA